MSGMTYLGLRTRQPLSTRACQSVHGGATQLDFDILRTFVAVAREKSFTRAATKLYLTQPTVSFRIDLLESELNQKLFERSGHNITITEAGRRFIPLVEQVLGTLDSAVETIRRFEEPEHRTLRLGTTSIAGTHLLTPILQQFRARHPHVAVTVCSGPSVRLCDMLFDDEIDVAMISLYHPLEQAHIRLLPIRWDPVLLVAKPGHPLARRERVALADLDGQALIAHAPTLALNKQVERMLQRERVRVEIGLQVDSLEVMKQLVAAGEGIAFVPEMTVSAEIARGDIVRLPLADPQPDPVPVGLAYRQRKSLPAEIEDFCSIAVGAKDHAIREAGLRHGLRSAPLPRRPRARSGRAPDTAFLPAATGKP